MSICKAEAASRRAGLSKYFVSFSVLSLMNEESRDLGEDFSTKYFTKKDFLVNRSSEISNANEKVKLSK